MHFTDVETILAQFHEALSTAKSPKEVEEIRRLHTGKKSAIKALLKGLRHLSPDERPTVAQAINQAHQRMDSDARAALESAYEDELNERLDAEWLDLSLPGKSGERGARHPLTDVENDCMALLRQLGFKRVEGPEIETAFFNFDALNIPEHHPARDMQDTFWVDGGLLLRSHTTTVQARCLESRPALPIRIASAGRVYRNEAVDATHLAMFHQMEGLWVDEGLTFAHLKGLLRFLAESLYGTERTLRFKPKFYPYTEPSIGVDIACANCSTGGCKSCGCESCHHSGWVTILGAGMVHPKVFKTFGYDPNTVSGIAFGLGTTRMAGQRSGVKKIRSLYEQDTRVMKALHRDDS